MPRTVSVKLAADVADFENGIKAASKSADDLKNKIEGTALAAEASGAAVDGLGRDFKGTARDARDLQGEIKQLDRELAELALAFAVADTAASKLDIFDSIQRKKGARRKLVEVNDLLPKPAEIEAAGKKAGKELGSGITGAFDNIKFGPALAAVLAVASPAIGAVLSAAVIGGAGVGGVVGGVLLAARDPRVKAAGTDLGHNLLGQLEQDAQPFVEPVLHGINEIEVAFAGMNSHIKSIFSGSSGFLDPLLHGALDGIDGLLGGIDDLVAKGGPVIKELGRDFGVIGHSVGDALGMIAGDSGDAADALSHLADATGFVIKAVGFTVRALTELYGFITFLPRHVEAFEKSLLGMDDGQKASVASASVLASVMGTVDKVVLTAGESAGKAGLDMATYASKMDEAAAKGRGLYDSQTAVAQAIADTKSALDKNGHSLDVNTQKGRDNRRALSDLAGALVSNYDAYVKVNGEGAAAGRVAEHNRTQFVKLASQFGIGSRAANDLADSMGLIKPKSVDVHVNTHDAVGRANAARDAIDGIHGKTVSVHVSVTGLEKLDSAGHRIGGFRASGGPVKKGEAYVVGDGGRPEVFVPDRDGMIVPSIDQYAASADAKAAAFGGTSVPNWRSAAGSTVINAPTTVNLAVSVGAGTHPAEAGREIAQALEAHFSRGGEIRVNGRVLVGNG